MECSVSNNWVRKLTDKLGSREGVGKIYKEFERTLTLDLGVKIG